MLHASNRLFAGGAWMESLAGQTCTVTGPVHVVGKTTMAVIARHAVEEVAIDMTWEPAPLSRSEASLLTDPLHREQRRPFSIRRRQAVLVQTTA